MPPSLHSIANDFEWLPDYDILLQQIASTDVVESEWTKLRDIIKYKIDKNTILFLSESGQGPPTPRSFSPQTLPSGGLKLPPFPPRKRNQLNMTEAPINYMNEEQANELKEYIFTQLHSFDSTPPFTIQRVCELCVYPRQNYNSVGKYLRAVEKSLLVTSTWDAFPPLSEKESDPSFRTAITIGSAPPTAPPTPLFSPIPFLHDDARRSKSRSPPPSPLVLGTGSAGSGHPEALEPKALGLVDELDDPGPGHMSDHPMALTSVTTMGPGSSPRPFLGSLDQRFVKSEGGGDEGGGSEGGAVEDMVIDETDKENKG